MSAPAGWAVTEWEESLEIRPLMENMASQVLNALTLLTRGEPAEGLIERSKPIPSGTYFSALKATFSTLSKSRL